MILDLVYAEAISNFDALIKLFIIIGLFSL